jgi:hypothetical protein
LWKILAKMLGGLLSQRALQDFAQDILFARVQFATLRSQIEDVNRFLALRIDQGDFDVAIESRERRSHVVQQAGAILRNHFEQRAVG